MIRRIMPGEQKLIVLCDTLMESLVGRRGTGGGLCRLLYPIGY